MYKKLEYLKEYLKFIFPIFCHEQRKQLNQKKNPKVFLINPNGKRKYYCPMTYQ